jgi:multiple sugar transport system substrate-binding protein
VTVPRPGTAAWPTIQTQFSKAFWNIYKGSDAATELRRAARLIDLDYQDNDDYGLG